jgi:hypothetical protein
LRRLAAAVAVVGTAVIQPLTHLPQIQFVREYRLGHGGHAVAEPELLDHRT